MLRNILLIDHDKKDRELFQNALDSLLFPTNLVCANDALELFDILYNEDRILPDLIFLNLNMSVKDGLETLQELGADERLKLIPVIIFSTSYRPSLADELYELGVKYYIRKPNSFRELKTAIHWILEMEDLKHPHEEESLVDLKQ
jgi:CheY-like chemotaxis protein